MKTPYQILAVPPEANDAEIKQAYLQQVKLNPPDKDQQRFQLIHNAYVAVKDVKSRVSYELFNVPDIDFDELVDQALSLTDINKISAEQFNTLFQVSIDDATIQNALPSKQK